MQCQSRETSGMRRFAPLLVCMAVLLAPAAAQGADQLYWSNDADDTIRRGPAAGGVQSVNLYAAGGSPNGLAIESSTDHLLWISSHPNPAAIRAAPLGGGGTVQQIYGTSEVSDPFGLAVDPAAQRVYWTNFSGTFNNTIRGATSAGGAAGQTLYSGADALDSESV